MELKKRLLLKLGPQEIPLDEDNYGRIPIDSLGILTREEKNALKNAGFHRIADLAYLWTEIVRISDSLGIDKNKLYILTAASRLITIKRPPLEDNYGLTKPISFFKIVVAGLDNSGKTSIITYLTQILPRTEFMERIKTLAPTLGVQRYQVSIAGLPLVLWELGGQENFRQQYLQFPERYFLETHLFLFVIDCSDRERRKNAIAYLSNVLRVMKFLQIDPLPPIRFFMHKIDQSDKINSEKYLQEYVQEIKTCISKEGFTEGPYYYTSVYDDKLRTVFGQILGEILPINEWIKEALKAVAKVTHALLSILVSLPVAVVLGIYDNRPLYEKHDWTSELFRVLKEIPEENFPRLYYTKEYQENKERYFFVLLGLTLKHKKFLYASVFHSGLDALTIDRRKVRQLLRHELAGLFDLFDFIYPLN